jgi:alkylhydroperoxidase/carboxymuconolactone decarboxylase family protein YurZ
MTVKKKSTLTAEQDTQTLTIKKEKGKSEIRQLTELQLSPIINNTVTLQAMAITISDKIDLNEAVAVMKEKSKKIIAGDLSELESTLTAQVVSLNAIYNTLALRSASNLGNSLKCTEIYMRLALKAQAQCARTVEVLAAMKNPPIVFAKQANIAHGHQQVNNGVQPATHAGKTINSSNELLSEADNAPLDTRRTLETGRVNQELAAVETVNRSKDTGR